jgi:hypothetical protein
MEKAQMRLRAVLENVVSKRAKTMLKASTHLGKKIFLALFAFPLFGVDPDNTAQILSCQLDLRPVLAPI